MTHHVIDPFQFVSLQGWEWMEVFVSCVGFQKAYCAGEIAHAFQAAFYEWVQVRADTPGKYNRRVGLSIQLGF